MINKVILIGHLGKDPEVRHLEGGSSVANFTIATNENYKDKSGEWQKQTEWHNIVAWGNLAEYSEKWLKKGMLVFIEGKLTHRKYQDKEGNDRYITEVKSVSIRTMEKREYSGDESGQQPMDISSTPPAFDQEDDLPF
jgi:single-strand DNA-binding protein